MGDHFFILIIMFYIRYESQILVLQESLSESREREKGLETVRHQLEKQLTATGNCYTSARESADSYR